MGEIIAQDCRRMVQRVNELYHDLTSEHYDNMHPEVFQEEKERWERIAKRFLNHNEPITVLDIGTGTGFVPIAIGRYLKRDDVFVCSDISSGILNVARRNVARNNLPCKFKFVKIHPTVPYRLPFETAVGDVVTMNSVLHHIEETDVFLEEVGRVLKPNGLLFVGHEPNRYFYRNVFLRSIRAVFRTAYFSMRHMKDGDSTFVRQACTRINNTLTEEKLISKPLSSNEIARIVDIKSEEGFEPKSLLQKSDLLYVETYNHLFGIITSRFSNRFTRKCEEILRKRFQKQGRLFFVVLRKSPEGAIAFLQIMGQKR